MLAKWWNLMLWVYNTFLNYNTFRYFIISHRNKEAESPAQAFSCEFCQISKNTFLAEQVWATASGNIVIA